MFDSNGSELNYNIVILGCSEFKKSIIPVSTSDLVLTILPPTAPSSVHDMYMLVYYNYKIYVIILKLNYAK